MSRQYKKWRENIFQLNLYNTERHESKLNAVEMFLGKIINKI